MLLFLCKYANNLERNQSPIFYIKNENSLFNMMWGKFFSLIILTCWIRSQWIVNYLKIFSIPLISHNLENLEMCYWWNNINTVHYFPSSSLPLNQARGLITVVTAYRGQKNMGTVGMEEAIAQSPGDGWHQAVTLSNCSFEVPIYHQTLFRDPAVLPIPTSFKADNRIHLDVSRIPGRMLLLPLTGYI